VINQTENVFSQQEDLGVGNKFAIEDNIAHYFLTHLIFYIL